MIQRFSITLPEDLHKEITDYANSVGGTMSGVIRKSVELFLKSKKEAKNE